MCGVGVACSVAVLREAPQSSGEVLAREADARKLGPWLTGEATVTVELDLLALLVDRHAKGARGLQEDADDEGTERQRMEEHKVTAASDGRRLFELERDRTHELVDGGRRGALERRGRDRRGGGSGLRANTDHCGEEGRREVRGGASTRGGANNWAGRREEEGNGRVYKVVP